MAFDYAGLANTVADILEEFGTSITITPPNTTTNLLTGEKTGAGTPIVGNGCLFEYEKSDIDGNNVQSGDMQLLMENVASEPPVNSVATVGGVDWKVIAVQPLQPGGVNLIYTLQVRK